MVKPSMTRIRKSGASNQRIGDVAAADPDESSNNHMACATYQYPPRPRSIWLTRRHLKCRNNPDPDGIYTLPSHQEHLIHGPGHVHQGQAT